MPKFNPWEDRFKRPAVTRKTLEFEHFSLTFREADEALRCLWLDRLAEYQEKHLEGTEEQPVLPLVTADGLVPASRELLRSVALAETLFVPDPGEAPYTLLDWVGIAQRFPVEWRAIKTALQSLLALPETEPGNAAGAAPST